MYFKCVSCSTLYVVLGDYNYCHPCLLNKNLKRCVYIMNEKYQCKNLTVDNKCILHKNII